MAITLSSPFVISHFRRWQLLGRLAREAGWPHLGRLGLCSTLGSVLDIAGLGIGMSLLFGAGYVSGKNFSVDLTVQQGLFVLILLLLSRSGLQGLIAVESERLRSGFTDRLRQQLLALVLHASSAQLAKVGRGELLGLLMANINQSVFSLDQGVRMLQALLASTLYLIGILVIGQATAVPLLLALAATAVAALLQRSGSWQLGLLRTQLNGALQRTVGDGLYGLKAVRAAAAEEWLLLRFKQETTRFRQVLRKTIQRQALFSIWRDGLVVLVVGFWLIWSQDELQKAIIATTLLLAYRASASLSAVITTQRLCVGALPAYEDLCKQRNVLMPREFKNNNSNTTNLVIPYGEPELWKSFCWRQIKDGQIFKSLVVPAGQLVAVVGPSGSGKTTLLDQICGLLNDDSSEWSLRVSDNTFDLYGSTGAKQLRKFLAYSPQNSTLFEASLQHNLILNSDVDADKIKPWFERLGLDDLLERPEGLDHPLSLASEPFSGGEIHRLGLLRAWLRACPIEVLDEPTAFLDETSAEVIRQIIYERKQHHLVVVSTHDPQLILMADQLIRLDTKNQQFAHPFFHGS